MEQANTKKFIRIVSYIIGGMLLTIIAAMVLPVVLYAALMFIVMER